MIVEALTDADEMPFGKYKGEKLSDVPADYLVWCFEEQAYGNNEAFKEYLKKNIRALLDEKKEKRR